MFWPAIIGDSNIRAFRIENGVKIDSRGYYAFLNKHFLPWWNKTASSFMKYASFYA